MVFPRERIQLNRGSYRAIAGIRQLEETNRHVRRRQPAEVEC